MAWVSGDFLSPAEIKLFLPQYICIVAVCVLLKNYSFALSSVMRIDFVGVNHKGNGSHAFITFNPRVLAYDDEISHNTQRSFPAGY